MKLKVCGIRTYEQMRQLQKLGVNYAGMIFYEKSKRHIGELSEAEREKMKALAIRKVGVFVNAEYDAIVKAISDYGLYAVQLHGDETDEFCLELMGKAKVIKVFRVANQTSIDELVKPFEAVCDYYLFDTDTAQYGGSGKQFDWNILDTAVIDKPFFLSGGIGLEDAGKLQTFQHPCLYAVDVNSRFETAPGVKDMRKVEMFIKRINHE